MKNGFSNHILISMPHMADPIFSKSIVLICNHSNDGAMGVIINKPIDRKKSGLILVETELDIIRPKPTIYYGGPVGIDSGIVIHNNKYVIDESISLSDRLSVTSSDKIIDDMKKGNGPDTFRIALGYSGWESGQLEQEIKNGDWIPISADSDFIFHIPDNQKWAIAVAQIGLDIEHSGGSAGLA